LTRAGTAASSSPSEGFDGVSSRSRSSKVSPGTIPLLPNVSSEPVSTTTSAPQPLGVLGAAGEELEQLVGGQVGREG
jgi:hypothetical protein